MIPRFLRPEVVPDASVETMPPALDYWVTLKFHASGLEQTHHFGSALSRALLIIAMTAHADVLDQGDPS
jgi:hypothetical protein